MPRTLKLAPVDAQDWAKARLDASPRHHEYVALKHRDRTVQTTVAGNKTAREEAFARVVKLLKGMG